MHAGIERSDRLRRRRPQPLAHAPPARAASGSRHRRPPPTTASIPTPRKPSPSPSWPTNSSRRARQSPSATGARHPALLGKRSHSSVSRIFVVLSLMIELADALLRIGRQTWFSRSLKNDRRKRFLPVPFLLSDRRSCCECTSSCLMIRTAPRNLARPEGQPSEIWMKYASDESVLTRARLAELRMPRWRRPAAGCSPARRRLRADSVWRTLSMGNSTAAVRQRQRLRRQVDLHHRPRRIDQLRREHRPAPRSATGRSSANCL